MSLKPLIHFRLFYKGESYKIQHSIDKKACKECRYETFATLSKIITLTNHFFHLRAKAWKIFIIDYIVNCNSSHAKLLCELHDCLLPIFTTLFETPPVLTSIISILSDRVLIKNSCCSKTKSIDQMLLLYMEAARNWIIWILSPDKQTSGQTSPDFLTHPAS